LTREDGRLPMSDFGGVHRYNVTGLVHDMWGFPSNDPKVAYDLLHHLVDKLENKADLLARYKEHYTEDAEILLISFGSAARTALHMVEQRRERGLKVGLLELQTLWPFPRQLIRRMCKGRSHVLVVEMNMGQVCQEVRKAVIRPERVYLANRFDGSSISPADILGVLNMIRGKGV
ncbi:MAG: 2-oxoacid:acceptor oxidoreductase subunit alpha, partial [Deltaproteobacteria bacterium]|nr:2-oxoacid:acceptor oxidoreductase subunit alpha [Deltaproteobacteria bacterium]